MVGGLGEYPRKHLGHRVGVQRLGDRTVHTYLTVPIRIRRPDRGLVVEEIGCGQCDARFRVRVRDANSTRWARRAWLAVAALGVLLTAASAFVMVAFGQPPPDHRPYVTPLWVELSFVPAAIGVVLLIFGIVAWRYVDGVKLLAEHGWEHQLLYPKRSKRR